MFERAWPQARRFGGAALFARAGCATAHEADLHDDDSEDGTANGWLVSAGTWAVVSDGSKVYAQTGAGTGSTVLASAAGATTWVNQRIEAKVKIKAFGGSSTSYFAAIYGRYNGTDY